MPRKKIEHRFHTQTFSIDDATEECLMILVDEADMPISRYIRRLIREKWKDYEDRKKHDKRAERFLDDLMTNVA